MKNKRVYFSIAIAILLCIITIVSVSANDVCDDYGHRWVNGNCTECGLACSHQNWDGYYCRDCGIYDGPSETTEAPITPPVEEPDDPEDESGSSGGSTGGTSHSHSFYVYSSYNFDGTHDVITACRSCTYSVTTKYSVPCTGSPCACGYTAPSVSDDLCDQGYHYYGSDYTCTNCGVVCTHQNWDGDYCRDCNKPYPENCSHEYLSTDKICLGCGKYIVPGSNNDTTENISYDLDYITCFNGVYGSTSYQPRAIRKNVYFNKADAAVVTKPDGTISMSGWASFSNGGLDSITVIVNFEDNEYLYFNSSSSYSDFSATLNPLKSDHINSINYNHTDVTMTGDYTTNGLYDISLDLSDYAGEKFSVMIYANTVYGSDEILIAQIKGLSVYLCSCEETFTVYEPLANGKHLIREKCLACNKEINTPIEADCEYNSGVCLYCASEFMPCDHNGTDKDTIVTPLEPGKHDVRFLCLECEGYAEEFLNYDCIYENGYCIWCNRNSDGLEKPEVETETETDSSDNSSPKVDITLDDIDFEFISLLFPSIIILVIIAAVLPGKSKKKRRR